MGASLNSEALARKMARKKDWDFKGFYVNL
jgi:hypothetical protein